MPSAGVGALTQNVLRRRAANTHGQLKLKRVDNVKYITLVDPYCSLWAREVVRNAVVGFSQAAPLGICVPSLVVWSPP
jgi:hypothetical protein